MRFMLAHPARATWAAGRLGGRAAERLGDIARAEGPLGDVARPRTRWRRRLVEDPLGVSALLTFPQSISIDSADALPR
jgi:hypothetical protein